MNHFKQSNNKLEKLRGIFFQLGIIIAGGLTLLAFEWTSSYVVEVPDGNPVTIEIIDELPPITYRTVPDKPKVVTKLTKFNPDVIDIIKDDPLTGDPTPDPTPEPDPIFDPGIYSTPNPELEPNPEPFLIVEKMPAFIGGNSKMKQYLKDNLKYPSLERAAGVEGTVYLQFVVNEKGEINEVEILRGVSQKIDKEAIRVIEAMPNWSPGKQRGRAVPVRFNLRVSFALK